MAASETDRERESEGEGEMIAGLIGAILLIAALGSAAGRVGRGSDDVSARRILDSRAAGGDLSPARRAEMLAVLDERNPSRGGRWLPWSLAIAGVTLLVLPAALPTGGSVDAGWGNHWTVMADHMGWNGGSTTTAASAERGAQEITVEAGDLWFEPAAIEIPAGTAINLTVENSGAVFHDLTVPELDLQVNVEAGETTTSAVSVETPGSYEFVCSVPGHAAGGMRGELIVTGTGA